MADKVRCEICDRTFKDTDGLAQHNTAKHSLQGHSNRQNPGNVLAGKGRKIRNWIIFLVVAGLIIWGVSSLIGGISGNSVVNEDELNFEVPKGPIHWHPHLTIKIDGKEIKIPKDVGIGSAHFPIHTHENDGTLHMENNRPSKKTVTLGYFFEVWGKKFSKDCILDYCSDKGTLKMYVNGKENFEFEKYFMHDKDEILIEYIARDSIN